MLKSLWRIVIGKPCVGERQARFDEGLLETRGATRSAPATYSARKLLALLIFIAGCAPTQKIVYPNVQKFINSSDFGRYKQLAVLPFVDAPNAPYSGQIIQGLVSQSLGRAGFNVVERSKLSEVLREQYLSLTGAISQTKSLELGKILGVKGIVLGEVGQYETMQRKTDTVYFPLALNGQTSYVPIQGQQWMESYVSISLRVIDVETGELAYSGSGQFGVGISNPPQEAASHIADAIIANWINSPGMCGFHFNNLFAIDNVFPSSPASKAKIRIGDRILKVNGKSVEGLSHLEFMGLIWGNPGDKLSLDLDRDGTIHKAEMIRVKREDIAIRK